MQDLENFLKSFTGDGQPVAVACSGGVDSMFLTVFSASILQKQGTNLISIIVDHKLQANSTHNALQTQKTLQKHGVSSVILTWHHEKIQTAIEEKARKARYLLISNYCKENNIKKVMLAHHIDDKIETFLMNSMRGTGLDGITSMRQHHTMHGIEYFRPILFLLEKAQIVEYMQAHFIPWIEDDTNQNITFTRNNIRHAINLTPAQKQGILQTAKNLDDIRENLNSEVETFFQKYALVDNFTVRFSVEISRLNREILFRVIKKTVAIVNTECNVEIRQKSIKRLYSWLSGDNAQHKITLAHCVFEKTKTGVKVYKEVKPNLPQI